ncbi:3-keto-5-aminohexanoate cleavage protein [Maricaulis sp.]|uniref:3-keto-5-aminohexanoate cleavage protein n=1 Tax=Maricaulis sp. TaxID=1486257 RepID=UPI0025BB5A0E|nr:3-keto-5-aminohexanoate cleavage protein [Maricaulis sp.]
MNKLILNLAPTGMIPTKAMTPHVPVTPAEIIADACECAALGAAIIHLHARDEAGRPTWQGDVYARIIEGIREQHPELILCASLSGRDFPEFEQRSAPLRLTGDARPDMASLTLSSLNFTGTASVNAPDMIQRLAAVMAEAGIRPELEVFDVGMINYANYLIDKGLLVGPHYFNVLLGNIASAQATPLHLASMTASLPAGAIWAAGGLGAAQLPANTLGILYGDGVRTGLEDMIWMDTARTLPATNKALVERIGQLAALMGRDIATPAEVRARLGMAR